MNRARYLAVETPIGIRRLAKFTKNGDGSVQLSFSPEPRFADGNTIEELLSKSEAEFVPGGKDTSVSLHASRNSSRLNVVRFHSDSKRLVTQALRFDSFTPVMFRAVSNLANDRHALEKFTPERDFILTEFDPSKDTLILSLVLGPKSKVFEKLEDHPSHVSHFDFDDFDVWLIWSFFNWPARPAGINFRFLGGSSDFPVRGFEIREIYDHHTDVISIYCNAYFRVF